MESKMSTRQRNKKKPLKSGKVNSNIENEYQRILMDDFCLDDKIIEDFHTLLRVNSNYKPRDVYLINKCFLDFIEPIQPGQSHLQIVYRPPGKRWTIGHWTALYYDGSVINVYDSMHLKFTKSQNNFIDKLFPFKPTIQFHNTVQIQQNQADCGVYAVAYCVSVLSGHGPENESYDEKSMRAHLVKILTEKVIIPFPSPTEDTDKAKTKISKRKRQMVKKKKPNAKNIKVGKKQNKKC